MVNNLLKICCICNEIRISKDPEIWLSENANPEQYKSLIEEYRENLSHGYCPPCTEKEREKIRKFKPVNKN